MKTVLVVGGGITGLSAMWELQKWKKETNADVRLILAEASNQLGGKIRTVENNGFIMEAGADSIVARKANSMSFIKELGLEDSVVYNATGRSFLYNEGSLKAIPADTIFGIPLSVESLATTDLISAEGKVAALKDLYIKNETFTKDDSIGDFLTYFLGEELVEKQIAPVLSGVYSGDLKDLTISSTLPYLFDYKEEYGSIIKGLEANKKKFQSGSGKKFISFEGGMGTLIDTYEQKLDEVEIWKNERVTSIDKNNGYYTVSFQNGEKIEANYVMLSVPHSVTASLLADNSVQEEFQSFENSSLISVYVGYDVPDSILPADGTGFITVDTDDLSCNACTWTSRKWTHTSQRGNLLVRLFYKSSHPSFHSIKGMNKEQLLQIALEDVKKSLGITAEPVTTEITEWLDNMPTYQITHPQIVASLEKKLEATYPGILLAGCSFYGVGIPDCIENGIVRARKIIDSFDSL